MKRCYLLTLLIFFVFNCLSVNAQNQARAIEWQKTFGGSGDDYANSIKQTADGGYIVAGYTESNDGDVIGNQGLSDFWVVKLDASSNIIWQKTLGGTGEDAANSIQQTIDGGFIVTGSTSSNNGDVTGHQGNGDFWVVKLDASGNLVWQKTLGGSGYDFASSIQQTMDGGYIIAGGTRSNNGDVTGFQGAVDFWVVKLDATGNLIWQKTLGGSGTDFANSIQQTMDGGYIIAGSTSSNNGDVTGNQGGYDFWVVKLDASGSIIWQKTLGGSSTEEAKSIQQTTDGGYILAGFTSSNNGDVTGFQGGYDFWVVKLDAAGNLIWQKTLGGSIVDYAYSILQTTEGGYIIAGFTRSNNGDVTGVQGASDFWVVKLDASGNLIWQKTLGGSSADEANSIQQTTDGGYIVAGFTGSTDGDVTGNQGSRDFWVVKLGVLSLNIVGNVYVEDMVNCSFDSVEATLPNFLVRQTSPYIRNVSTDSSGVFSIPVFDTATYQFEPIIPQYLDVLIENNCSTSYSVLIDSLGADTSGFDFGFNAESCPLLIVDVGSNRRRPCFTSNTSVSYRNDGFAEETNVQIVVELPDSVYPVSASNSYTLNSLGQLVFNIDTLSAGASGIITVQDSMACELSLSNTQACTKAWISPANTCYNNLVNPSPWDSSNIVINGGIQLDSLGDTCFRFVITNIGADMQDSLAYSIYSGTGFIQSDSFLLGNNDSMAIVVCGVDYAQILIYQNVNHPSSPIVFFSPLTSDTSVLDIYEFINVDENLESSIECLTVVNAYDPNDKNATPAGWGDENYVSTSTLLDYKIRFQNTGNDTAYNIEVIDTIDATVFDISKLILGGSSHPYNFEVSGDSGQVVFHFLFNNINLVDSFTNEPLSHGFVNFKIGAYDNILQGTVANNFADIYFDFNPPIRTNTSMVTMQDTIPIENNSGITIKVETLVQDTTGIRNILNTNINIYPNPANNKVHIIIDENTKTINYQLRLVDITGKLILNEAINSKETIINTSTIENGIYIIQILAANNLQYNSKLIISR